MKEYNRYKFKSGAKVIKGEKLDFSKFLLKYIKKNDVVLDLGCGSGELTIQMSHYCKKIVGVDCCQLYIETAKSDQKHKKIKNVFFKVGDGRKMPFKGNTFDLIYSSRGPLSANQTFFKEALRVLKPHGLLIEETIGETDKIELKRIFERGQNYPYTIKKSEAVVKLFNKNKVELVFMKDSIYYQRFLSFRLLVNTLNRAPIIPGFDERKDLRPLAKIDKLCQNNGIVLRAHRLWWIAKK